MKLITAIRAQAGKNRSMEDLLKNNLDELRRNGTARKYLKNLLMALSCESRVALGPTLLKPPDTTVSAEIWLSHDLPEVSSLPNSR
jgi:hypothetical protein